MIHKDERGTIKDLIVREGASVTFITFKKGAIRGNHYHKETVQYDFILSGKLLCAAGNKQERIVAGELITHEAKIPHAYEALEDSEIISICFGKRVGEDYSKDTFKLEIPLL